MAPSFERRTLCCVGSEGFKGHKLHLLTGEGGRGLKQLICLLPQHTEGSHLLLRWSAVQLWGAQSPCVCGPSGTAWRNGGWHLEKSFRFLCSSLVGGKTSGGRLTGCAAGRKVRQLLRLQRQPDWVPGLCWHSRPDCASFLQPKAREWHIWVRCAVEQVGPPTCLRTVAPSLTPAIKTVKDRAAIPRPMSAQPAASGSAPGLRPTQLQSFWAAIGSCHPPAARLAPGALSFGTLLVRADGVRSGRVGRAWLRWVGQVLLRRLHLLCSNPGFCQGFQQVYGQRGRGFGGHGGLQLLLKVGHLRLLVLLFLGELLHLIQALLVLLLLPVPASPEGAALDAIKARSFCAAALKFLLASLSCCCGVCLGSAAAMAAKALLDLLREGLLVPPAELS